MSGLFKKFSPICSNPAVSVTLGFNQNVKPNSKFATYSWLNKSVVRIRLAGTKRDLAIRQHDKNSFILLTVPRSNKNIDALLYDTPLFDNDWPIMFNVRGYEEPPQPPMISPRAFRTFTTFEKPFVNSDNVAERFQKIFTESSAVNTLLVRIEALNFIDELCQAISDWVWGNHPKALFREHHRTLTLKRFFSEVLKPVFREDFFKNSVGLVESGLLSPVEPFVSIGELESRVKRL